MSTTLAIGQRPHDAPLSESRRRSSRAGLRAVSACCMVIAVMLYAFSPLATLLQAANGVRNGDVAALRDALDWKSVRAGLKQDIAQNLDSGPATAQAAVAEDELPAFGSSFVTTVASHAIDNEMTPEALMRLLSGQAGPATDWRGVLGRIASLRFTGPSQFEAAIRMGGPDAKPTLLSMRLEQWHWRITHLELPSDDDAPPATHRT
ncbi:DUF2939 domain-containing protein [Acetobacteraceae bacterium KSS8]|uniref:DUF2939 domain-containing protein n=1 Tax=Endosaccharibacter trunci TaxID=2812733 RepID=A0ABT1WA67_9PROT|nr:DUF2939 domain-containing protein [Acetobacteraceae bacterium KSS8]